jgi:hypothetical protein
VVHIQTEERLASKAPGRLHLEVSTHHTVEGMQQEAQVGREEEPGGHQEEIRCTRAEEGDEEVHREGASIPAGYSSVADTEELRKKVDGRPVGIGNKHCPENRGSADTVAEDEADEAVGILQEG